MKTISQVFDTAFQTKARRGWEKIFVIVDIHETILLPTWSEQRSNEYYPMAKESLQLLTEMDDVCLIQWSSSSGTNNFMYKSEFAKDNIHMDYINDNPEVPSTEYADFDSKLYMNVIMDDKAGFEPSDWIELHSYLLKLKSERAR